MNPVQKAIWYIESHFTEHLGLEDIARVVGVSHYHLTRAFAGVTGVSVMRYLRARRLSEAAKLLANGAPDILSLALEAGYGSHEAFTRAFSEQFGLTPEQLRAQGNLQSIPLVEAITLDQTLPITLAPPRFENGKAFLMAGLNERYACNNSAGIPAQWQRFLPYLGQVQGQVGGIAYGVTYNTDEDGNMDYMCAVEVADFSHLPPTFSRLRIPAQKYVVFTHKDHISAIRSTWAAVWSSWFPQSGHEASDAPNFERYSESFNPHTGLGGLELWVPIKA